MEAVVVPGVGRPMTLPIALGMSSGALVGFIASLFLGEKGALTLLGTMAGVLVGGIWEKVSDRKM